MIRLHDTLAREKRDFVPADPKAITMYVCGPTVYGRAHIGNARPAVVFDTLARLIRHEYGPDSLTYARNITDIDDKIIEAAKAEGVTIREITTRYEKHYLDDMGALGVLKPDFAPHATAFVPQMINMIERLIKAEYAYASEGHVLFEVSKDPQYGVLSRRDRESMRAGARVEVATYKRDDGDFVLWKPSSEDVVGWDSPWGRGRPGWHIECSAMIESWFGDVKGLDTIDIHGGGLDLIFPHHENEIAQSRCAHDGAPLARYWVHNGFVDMGAEKMSKSLGNVVTVDRLLAEGHRGETLRMALLSSHYRQPLPWTEGLIAQSKVTLDRWYRGLQRFLLDYDPEEFDPHPDVIDALSDDLNTPAALSVLSEGLSDLSGETGNEVFTINSETGSWIAAAKFLGLLQYSANEWFRANYVLIADTGRYEMRFGEIEGRIGSKVIEERIAERNAAKVKRDFATSDQIRDELKSEGILLEDGPDGTTWRRA